MPIAAAGSVARTPPGAAQRLPWGAGTLSVFLGAVRPVFSIMPLKDMHSPRAVMVPSGPGTDATSGGEFGGFSLPSPLCADTALHPRGWLLQGTGLRVTSGHGGGGPPVQCWRTSSPEETSRAGQAMAPSKNQCLPGCLTSPLGYKGFGLPCAAPFSCLEHREGARGATSQHSHTTGGSHRKPRLAP